MSEEKIIDESVEMMLADPETLPLQLKGMMMTVNRLEAEITELKSTHNAHWCSTNQDLKAEVERLKELVRDAMESDNEFLSEWDLKARELLK